MMIGSAICSNLGLVVLCSCMALRARCPALPCACVESQRPGEQRHSGISHNIYDLTQKQCEKESRRGGGLQSGLHMFSNFRLKQLKVPSEFIERYHLTSV